MKNRFFAVALLAFALVFCACEEDKYYSAMPTYSDIVVEHLNPEKSGNFYVGDTILATAVEHTRGKWIYKVSLSWEAENGTRFFNSIGKFVYGTVPGNLTDTIVLNAAGTGKITVNIDFRSMSADMRQYNVDVPNSGNGFSASYETIGFEHYKATLKKTFRILPKP